LPISFDGTSNGIQHLALLSRNVEAGHLVNLCDTDVPRDVYLVVTEYIIKLLAEEDPRLRSTNKEKKIDDAWCYGWWLDRLHDRSSKDRRKLLKNPIMTFYYSSSSSGRAEAIVGVYRRLFGLNEPALAEEPGASCHWLRSEAMYFLAKAVRIACEDKLKGPAEVMKYIRQLATYRYRQGKFLEWRTLTGFPVINTYRESNIRNVDLNYGGIRSRYKVADGNLPKTRNVKMLNAAAPNFVHSLDATHLVLTILAANKDKPVPIRDVIPVHDCMACLAPHAQRFGQIIREQLAMLYQIDPLRALREANVDDPSDPNVLPLPRRGSLDPLKDVWRAEYAFM
jgi:DNA-directed RNA polymerase